VVYGFKGSKTWFTDVAGLSMSNLIGVQVRVDDIKSVGIDQTIQRQFVGVTQDAGVMESNGAVYFENSTAWHPEVRTVVGLREDAFTFDVKDRMIDPANGRCDGSTDPLGCDTGTRRATIFSPKFGLILGPWANTTYYLNVAEGYHSNDARGVTRNGTDVNGDPVQSATPLVRAKSAEIGLRSKPVPKWDFGVDVFMLKLASELVFTGDAGTTEPSGATTRTGVEISNKFYFTEWLTGDLNGAITRGRFDKPAEADDVGCGDGAAAGFPCTNPPAYVGRYIPNSPTRVVDFGLTAQSPAGWFGSIRGRHFGDSPLVEDNSIKAPSYTTFDLALGYQQDKDWRFVLDVFNLFDKKWNDIAYYYATRLSGEANAQPDFVVHSGVPRTIRGTFTYFF
jgi:outer membrane receptor protein involved in Fe transport